MHRGRVRIVWSWCGSTPPTMHLQLPRMPSLAQKPPPYACRLPCLLAGGLWHADPASPGGPATGGSWVQAAHGALPPWAAAAPAGRLGSCYWELVGRLACSGPRGPTLPHRTKPIAAITDGRLLSRSPAPPLPHLPQPAGRAGQRLWLCTEGWPPDDTGAGARIGGACRLPRSSVGFQSSAACLGAIAAGSKGAGSAHLSAHAHVCAPLLLGPPPLLQLGVDATDEELLLAVAERAAAPGTHAHNEPFAVTPAALHDAMRAADALGRQYLAAAAAASGGGGA